MKIKLQRIIKMLPSFDFTSQSIRPFLSFKPNFSEAIVAILSENADVNKQNLTAAGRSEFAPLASNATADGKAKNRRIEIILTPRLDEIAEMLKDIN